MCNRPTDTSDYKHIVDPLSLHILRSRNRLMLQNIGISDSSYYYSLYKNQPNQIIPKVNNIPVNNYGVRKIPQSSLAHDAVNNSNFSYTSTKLETSNSRKFVNSNKEKALNRNSLDNTIPSMSPIPTLLTATSAMYPQNMQHPLTVPNILRLDTPHAKLSTDKMIALPSIDYIHNITPMDLPLLDANCNGVFSAFLQRRQRGEKRPIPEEQKDEKYYEKRKRNNEAAKKSRDARKIREDRIAFRAAFLEQENSILKAQLITLRNELQTLILNKRNV